MARMTLEQIKALQPKIDRRKIDELLRAKGLIVA